MTIEGVAALLLGYDSNSLLLEAFGVDSILELVSAFVLLWRLRVELRGPANEKRIEKAERQASRIVGYTLYLLVALVLFTSFFKLLVSPAPTDTHESVWGIGIGLVANVGMPLLAAWKLRLAARLDSRALRADAMEAITCGYLSVVLMVGLGATWLLGWWWLDSVASLALIPFLMKEGREAVEGECCCQCECPAS
jgi:divalent metal cation (Fe/Co/Zn/Cd) transporter